MKCSKFILLAPWEEGGQWSTLDVLTVNFLVFSNFENLSTSFKDPWTELNSLKNIVQKVSKRFWHMHISVAMEKLSRPPLLFETLENKS